MKVFSLCLKICKKVCTIGRMYVIIKLNYLINFIQHKGDNDNAKICSS